MSSERETEIGMLHLQAKECQKLLAATRSPKRGMEQSSRKVPLEGTSPVLTLIVDFGQENMFLWV